MANFRYRALGYLWYMTSAVTNEFWFTERESQLDVKSKLSCTCFWWRNLWLCRDKTDADNSLSAPHNVCARNSEFMPIRCSGLICKTKSHLWASAASLSVCRWKIHRHQTPFCITHKTLPKIGAVCDCACETRLSACKRSIMCTSNIYVRGDTEIHWRSTLTFSK